MNPAVLRACGVAAASACIGAACADETPLVVQVVGHYNQSVGSLDAASEGSVRSTLIENRPVLRVGELLEFVPGMIVTQHSGDGKANQYFLRGFNLDHGTDFATYVDGMPVNMRSHAHGQGYSDLNFLIPELAQRIDYRKGPYFADEGDFASAGAAHIHLASKLEQGSANVSLGSQGYRRLLLADSLTAVDGTLLYGLELGRNDGPWETPEQVRKYSAMLRYSQGSHDDGFNLTAMAYRNRWNATDQIPLRAVQSGRIGRFGSIDASDGGASSRYSLSYAMRKRNGERLVEVEGYAIRSSLDLFSNFSYALAHPAVGDQFTQSEKRTTVGGNAGVAWQDAVGSVETRHRVGVQLRYDRIAPIGLYESVMRQRTAVLREDRVREASAGFYYENSSQLLPSLRSVAGLRYDLYRFNVNGAQVSASKVSPKLSLILGPWKKTEFFLNYGRGFHSNDARGIVGAAAGEESGKVAALAGTRGMELGARSEPLPGLHSSLALWRLDLSSELVYLGDAGQTEASRRSRRQGIEWNNHYIVSPWLQFDLDLAASRARYTEGDGAASFVPGAVNRVASFGVTLDGRNGWRGSFNLRHFGPRPLTEDNSARSAATTLASARLAWRIDSRSSLSFDVFNVFDKRASDIDYFYQSRLPGEAAEGVSDIHFHPVEPRSFRLTLTRRF
ncbi:TonB-dependent receptor [Massilia sp. NR 4-1]|uniref:TonB-dependent receptor n=1 Tax=Massilia sp. NR 4-1 TaxID=1678028 RepID=UPI00067E2AAE|nr:TonB-dependent receptor [Massilia sp. NR 4-1]